MNQKQENDMKKGVYSFGKHLSHVIFYVLLNRTDVFH